MADPKKPFKVRTVDGAFHSEHETEEASVVAADTANDAAKKLGIRTRYNATGAE